MNAYGKQWAWELERAKAAGFEPAKEYDTMIRRMAQLKEGQLWEFPFKEASEQMDSLRRELEEYRAELKKRGEQLKESREELESTIRNLKKGSNHFRRRYRL